ncbi:TRAP transporter small permease [uncultured Fusobacterium sp.]|uniref:TRAP transporter small permease n=1 Tax=uncultured Fusobacterium sp. TaxID=159267 RepID=UPI0027DADF03|nr:TRAP transporter small permease [uncultured Fusobacterium sp.]
MLKKLDDFLENIENIILIITGIAVCLLIFIGAMMRYIFKIDFYGSEEIILFISFWLYFTGSAVAAKKNSHIDANMLSIFIKNQKTLQIFSLIKNLIALFIAVIVTFWCYKYVSWSADMGAASNVFKLPNIIGQIPIFISFFIWDIYLIRDVINNFKNLKTFFS